MDTIWSYIFPKKMTEREKILKVLSETLIFSGLPRQKLSKLLRALHERFYRKGETVFRVGEPGVGMYVICEGEVLVTIAGPHGEEQEVARLTPGQTFGDLALIEDHLRSATVRASEPTRLLGLIRSEFMELLTRDPSLGVEILLRLLKMVGERLTITNQNLVKVQTQFELLQKEYNINRSLTQLVQGDARPLDDFDAS